MKITAKQITPDFIVETVHRSVAIAYNEATRNLNFLAIAPVTKKQAIAILKDCVPSYNEFKPSLLNGLPDDVKVFIAREGSVCIYVCGNHEHLKDTLQADECNFKNTYPHYNVTRFWWD